MSRLTGRSGLRILAALGAAVVLAAPPAHASADDSCASLSDGPSLVVHVIGADGNPVPSSPASFSMQDICNDGDTTGPGGNAINYGLRDARGHTFSDSSNNVLSINGLLGLVQVDGQPLDFHSGYTEVPTPSGVPSTLSGADLSPAGDFANGLLPAVYAFNNTTLAYLRPLRSDPDDVNADEWVRTSGTLNLTFHVGGTLLTVTQGAPSATRVKVGDPDSFTAAASGGTAPYTYAWDFADGTTGSGAASSHRFTAPGTYYVSVTAHDQKGNYGRSAYVPITVICNPATDPHRCGKPPPGGGPPGGPGGGHHPPGHHPPSGPVKGGGHHQGGHPGGSDHPQHGTTTPGRHSTGPGSGQTGPTGPGRQGHKRSRQHPPSTSPGSGSSVSGLLLVGTHDVAAAVPQLVLQQATAARVSAEPHWSWPWKWSAALVVPLLIGLGMAGESLQLRRRVARMGA